MQKLVQSMVRFSAATTLFGVQQLQNVADLVTDKEGARKKLESSLDAITGALTNEMDESKRSAVDSATKLVDKTYDAFDVPMFSPKKLVDNVTDVMRKTADTFADAVEKASPKENKETKEAGEPVQASTILTAEG